MQRLIRPLAIAATVGAALLVSASPSAAQGQGPYGAPSGYRLSPVVVPQTTAAPNAPFPRGFRPLDKQWRTDFWAGAHDSIPAFQDHYKTYQLPPGYVPQSSGLPPRGQLLFDQSWNQARTMPPGPDGYTVQFKIGFRDSFRDQYLNGGRRRQFAPPTYAVPIQPYRP